VPNVAALNRLDRLIRRHKLHSDSTDPVNLTPLLESFTQFYASLPHAVQAYTLRWRSPRVRRQLVSITYADILVEPSESARLRHAQAHEFAHIFLRHEGNEFVMWAQSPDFSCEALAEWQRGLQEKDCEAISAYLLVPIGALRYWHGSPSQFIADKLDVPAHLVEARWAIWRKYGR
jgi:hypothetical protein